MDTDKTTAVVAAAVATSSQPSPTLLPSPVARAVSLATRSTGLAIRLGSFVGSYGLDAARFTTLSSLDLARGVVEGVLSRAGRDTISQSQSKLAAIDAETILERSLETLHFAVTQAVFWTSASFQLTNTTLSAASELSQLMLSSFDQLFGSTDSSRAIASIITLVRREFRNPATGIRREKISVIDLTLALSALAYLQRQCRKSAEEESRRQAAEEVIWDVVVLNDGERVDVEDDTVTATAPAPLPDLPSPRPVSRPQTGRRLSDDDEEVMSRLKTQIASSIPRGTSVSISSNISTVQTITVDVDGSQPLSLPTPPGAEIVAIKPQTAGCEGKDDLQDACSYRVVYKIERNKFRATSFRHEEDADDESINAPRLGFSDMQTAGRDSEEVLLSPLSSTSESGSDQETPRAKTPPAVSVSTPSRSLDRELENVTPDLRTPDPSKPRPLSERKVDNAANQKRQRSSLSRGSSKENLQKQRQDAIPSRKLSIKKRTTEPPGLLKPAERKGGFKQVLRGSGQSLSNMLGKESAHNAGQVSLTKAKPQWKTPGGSASEKSARLKPPVYHGPTVPVLSDPPRSGRQSSASMPRSSSRASYVSIHERRRDSIVSQTDSYSIHSPEGLRSVSPSLLRLDTNQDAVTVSHNDPYPMEASPGIPHRRIGSYAPSLYSLATNDSQSSLVLSSYYQKSAFRASDALGTLRREGFVDGTFPAGHLLQNITRYMRFSSASYGSHFLRLMGLSKDSPKLTTRDGTHQDVRHFLQHTESEAGNILLASFVDPQGGSNSTGATGTGIPLVHYISLDHEAKAVILACRGTLGFEDVLADMTCDYDRLPWRGRSYKVHKGIHASARRLLYGGDGRVLVTLKEALREFPDYGLVLCGHSLGGAVTALLGVMLSEPNPNGSGFVTSPEAKTRLLPEKDSVSKGFSDLRLPPGRRIHVYAYGPPGVMSRSLCKLTKGLVTSVVHGSDIVPHLSLGLLHDFQNVAAAFKDDENSAKAEIRQRLWSTFQDNIADRWYHHTPKAPTGYEEQWMLPTLNNLRSHMKSEKLMPPGEVFTIETQRVLRRDAFVFVDEQHIGRPAQRIVLKYVKDAEARFGEIRFGTSMLTDHSPAKYEEALNKLRIGVAG